MDIDLTRISRALKIRRPEIYYTDAVVLAASSLEHPRIFISPRLLKPESLKDQDTVNLILAIKLEGCSHRECVSFTVAHELGHQVQLRNLGSDALIAAYNATVMQVHSLYDPTLPSTNDLNLSVNIMQRH